MSSPNLEHDIIKADWLCKKIQESNDYAISFYGALCNNIFQKLDVMPILKEQHWSCSWRYAGGIVANVRNKRENYLDFYCSGNEGYIIEEVEDDLKKLGWIPLTHNEY